MGIVQITRNVLECDGCKAVFGTPTGFVSTTEVRAAAYADGWRFPNQVSARTGDPINSTSDVCPDCAPEWTPQTRAPRQRHASQAELEAWT